MYMKTRAEMHVLEMHMSQTRFPTTSEADISKLTIKISVNGSADD